MLVLEHTQDDMSPPRLTHYLSLPVSRPSSQQADKPSFGLFNSVHTQTQALLMQKTASWKPLHHISHQNRPTLPSVPLSSRCMLLGIDRMMLLSGLTLCYCIMPQDLFIT